MAVTALLKLAGLPNDLRAVDIAHKALAQMQTPTGGGMMASCRDFACQAPVAAPEGLRAQMECP